MLSDLRASIVGRKKKRHPADELMLLVDTWIDPMTRAAEVYAQSEALGAEILRCRREMQKNRRQRKTGAPGESPESSTLMSGGLGEKERCEHDEHDVEGSIINFYANILSSTNLVLDPVPVEDVHPAFRSPMVCTPAAGAICRDLSRRSWQTAYSGSIYSNLTGIRDDTRHKDSIQELERKGSDEYAEKYRKLVVVAEADD